MEEGRKMGVDRLQRGKARLEGRHQCEEARVVRLLQARLQGQNYCEEAFRLLLRSNAEEPAM
jgi:hypothetical protein